MLPWLAVNLLGIAIAAGCLALAWRLPRLRFALAAALLLLLVAKAALTWLPVEEAALLPWAWYAWLQGYWAFAIGAAFLAFAITQMPQPRTRLLVGLLALAVLVRGGGETAWMLRQRPLGAEVAPGEEHHLMQTTGYTCAPSAAAIALDYVGVRRTEREMARLCLTRLEGGTTVFNTWRGLRLALDGSGWRPRLARVTPEELCLPGRVAVIDFPEIRHAITVVGRGEDVLLHDPLADAPRPLARADLARRYGGTAIILEAAP